MKKNKRERGTEGEILAANYIEDKGYEIIKRNYRCPIGEIDLIARDGECLVFIEVRCRWSRLFGTPEESITKKKRERLAKIAQYYLSKELCREVLCRFDFIGMELDNKDKIIRLNHVKDIISW